MSKKNLRELQRLEAIRRLKKLEKKCILSPKILEDYEKGKILVSAWDRLIDIKRFKSLKEEIKKFEKDENALVYHCITCSTYGTVIILLLFVGNDNNEWFGERLIENKNTKGKVVKRLIMAQCLNLTERKHIAYGICTLSSCKGVLREIGWFA